MTFVLVLSISRCLGLLIFEDGKAKAGFRQCPNNWGGWTLTLVRGGLSVQGVSSWHCMVPVWVWYGAGKVELFFLPFLCAPASYPAPGRGWPVGLETHFPMGRTTREDFEPVRKAWLRKEQ